MSERAPPDAPPTPGPATVDEARWRELLPLFEHAIDLSTAEREVWLSDLERQRPQTAASLRAALAQDEALESQRFLEEGPKWGATGSLLGRTIGAYTIERLIGEGGMGEVWCARRSDGRFERKVAVKLMRAALASRHARERFEREGRLLARLTHPNIAPLVDAGVTADNRPYIVLEYIEGHPIDRHCDLLALGIEARLRLFQDVLAAVAHAHDRLVIHRDLKPSNVLVTGEGSVKLLDFGIAKLMDPEEGATTASDLTELADAAFTPDYAAPEQILREPVSAATDVYQLGVLLYGLLSGMHPYARSGMGRRELLNCTLQTEPPLMSDSIAHAAAEDSESITSRAQRRDTTPQRLRAVLRGDLDAILAKALRKDPADRYSSAAAFASDVARYLEHQPVSARSGALRYRARKFMRRHRAAIAGGTMAASALIATTVFALVQMHEARTQRDEARVQSERARAESNFALLMMNKIGAGGRAATLEEILDGGVSIVQKQYAADPRFAVNTLINLSGRYMDIGNRRKEHAALVQAEALARRLGPAELAEVECDTVETEVALADFAAAERRLKEARAALAQVSSPAAGLVSDCLNAQASLESARGRMPEAIAAAEQAGAVLRQAPDGPYTVRYTGVQSHLELLYASVGNISKAIEINRSRQALVRQSGQEGTVRLLRAQHSEATYLADMGQIRDALAREQDVVNRSSSKDGNPLHPTVSETYGELLLRTEHAEEALPWLDQSMQAWHAQGANARELVPRALRSRALLALGRLDEARAELPDVSSIAAGDEQGRQSFVRAGTIRAGVLLALRDVAQAREQMESVLGTLRSASDCARWSVPAFVMAARVAEASGRRAEAGHYAAEALTIAEQRAPDPERSADVGEALLLLAILRRAEGDSRAARPLIARARIALNNSLGADHSLTRSAEALTRRSL